MVVFDLVVCIGIEYYGSKQYYDEPWTSRRCCSRVVGAVCVGGRRRRTGRKSDSQFEKEYETYLREILEISSSIYVPMYWILVKDSVVSEYTYNYFLVTSAVFQTCSRPNHMPPPSAVQRPPP
jgi:hypothetical protein